MEIRQTRADRVGQDKCKLYKYKNVKCINIKVGNLTFFVKNKTFFIFLLSNKKYYKYK